MLPENRQWLGTLAKFGVGWPEIKPRVSAIWIGRHARRMLPFAPNRRLRYPQNPSRPLIWVRPGPSVLSLGVVDQTVHVPLERYLRLDPQGVRADDGPDNRSVRDKQREHARVQTWR